MPGSTLVRVAVIVVALGGAVAAYQWWESPERQIRRTIRDAVSALAHDEPDTSLRAIAAVAGLNAVMSPDVSVDAGSSSPLIGRSDVVSMAARIRTTLPMLRIQLFDEEISFESDVEAHVRLTAQVTTRGPDGEELADAHHVIVALSQVGGQWLITRVAIEGKALSL